jgi:hypothetical protein
MKHVMTLSTDICRYNRTEFILIDVKVNCIKVLYSSLNTRPLHEYNRTLRGMYNVNAASMLILTGATM